MLRAALTSVLLAAGCPAEVAPDVEDAPPEATPPTDEAAAPAVPVSAPPTGGAPWGTFDPSGLVEALQGESTIHISAMGLVDYEGPRPMMEDMSLVVDGDRARLTAARGEVVEGTLSAISPCEVKLTLPSGMATSWNLARDGDQLWLGLGGAGVRLGEGWLVCEERGVILYDGSSCTWHQEGFRPGGFDAPTPVECSLEEGILSYQVPKFMRDGEHDARSMKIHGKALLSEQMESDHAVER